MQGWVTLHASDGSGSAREQVGALPNVNITLRDAICRKCNNEWLSRIETRASRILKPMSVEGQHAVLDAAAQALLSLWAAKTCLLLELAVRQMYAGKRLVEGYQATAQELAWLRQKSEPPPRSMVWLGYWDCQKSAPVNYEPSSAVLPTADGAVLAGHLTTFSLGFVAFQVFTVDFLAAEQHGAPVWNPRVPKSLAGSLDRIYPALLRQPEVTWPPARPFAKGEWRRIVTWDGRLRPEA